MSQAYIFDIDEANFDSVVIENSHKIPILVDFWAEWCEPCKSLIPVLHKLAEDMAGQFVLAKVNADQEQAVAQKYGVRSLPTVKLFFQGEVVEEFSGAQPEHFIRELLEKYIPRESDQMMAAAIEEYKQGNVDAAIQLMAQASQMDPANTRVQVMYARALLDNDQADVALALLQSLSDEAKEDQEVKGLLMQLEISSQAAGSDEADELLAQIEANQDDFAAREKLSAFYVATGNHDAALEQLFIIMKSDPEYNDGAGKKGLFNMFDMLGAENPLVSQYRRRMASLIN